MVPSLPSELMKTAVPPERGSTEYLADKAAIVLVHTSGADTDNVISGGNGEAGVNAQSDVAAAIGVVRERNSTDGSVEGAGSVAKERSSTGGRIADAGGVARRAPELHWPCFQRR